MRYGVYISNYGAYGTAGDIVDLAVRAEAAGWDGYFMSDVLRGGGEPVADAQITLGGVAARTDAITFGALVTPLGRRRPWKVAREITTLAQLSGGRYVQGCSVGSAHDFVFPGEVKTGAERVARFTDALEVIHQVVSGDPVEWTQSGRSARVLGEPPDEISLEAFFPAVAAPVPFWGGASIQRGDHKQRLGPFRRAARLLDGLFPVGDPWDSRRPITPEEFALAVEYAFGGESAPEGFDLVASGSGLSEDAGADVDRFASEGATWWLSVFPEDVTPAQIGPIIDAGPPRS